MKKPPYDLTAAIIEYEDGQMSHERVIELFQYLVDTGIAWQLQGAYGRTAKTLLAIGEIQPPRHAHPRS